MEPHPGPTTGGNRPAAPATEATVPGSTGADLWLPGTPVAGRTGVGGSGRAVVPSQAGSGPRPSITATPGLCHLALENRLMRAVSLTIFQGFWRRFAF